MRVEADKVGIITLNRPKQLNALNDQLMNELGAALKAFDADEKIGCMIVTGSEKAFAGGRHRRHGQVQLLPTPTRATITTRNWETIRSIRKPVIAAVSGFALGGGCELAMMCDFIIAADNAKFGQPGDQAGRDPRCRWHAAPAPRRGQVQGHGHGTDRPHDGRDRSRARRAGQPRGGRDKLMDEALGAAIIISGFSQIAVMAAKESVNRAFEGTSPTA